MRGDEMKKGSALLIVLGMVAFMVVSAVGFAVFMRHNRIPSSFLRRSTAARELARAALACAMSDIESAIELLLILFRTMKVMHLHLIITDIPLLLCKENYLINIRIICSLERL